MERSPTVQQDIEKLFDEQMRVRQKKEQERKIRNYRALNRIAPKGGILFTGSSLMEYFPICEMAMSAGIKKLIYNRGISLKKSIRCFWTCSLRKSSSISERTI